MKKEIRLSEKISYTTALLGQNMIYNFMAMYIMFFFTDILRIPASAVTVIVVIASLWDAINDPIMGAIADRTRTKFGKFRPYLIFGPPFIFISTVLCFTLFSSDPMKSLVFSTVFYILWDMSYTVSDVPIWAMSSVISRNPGEKNRMVTLGKIGGTIGTVIVAVGSISIINALGGERNGKAYFYSALLIAAIGSILMVICGIILKERIEPQKEKADLRNEIRTITQNRPMLFLMIALLLVNMVNNIRQAVQLYFVVYAWGDSSYVTYVGASLVLGMVLGMAVTPKVIDHAGKKQVFIAACIFGAVFSLLPMLILTSSVIFGLIMLCLSFAFTGVTTITSAAMLMDVIDYSEYRLGFRGEGIVFSINTFLNKLSNTISKAILGIMMVAIGYVDAMERTPLVTFSFSSMMYLVPAIAFALTIIPLLFYDLTDEKLAKIQKSLNNKGDIYGDI